MPAKLPCMKCELTDNSNGLFTCNGCRGNFCLNHLTDHSNELRNRFEEVINQYNIVYNIFRENQQKSSDFDGKIRDKQEKELNETKVQLDECEKTSNYSEQELDQWMTRLNKLKVQLTKTNESHSFIKQLHTFVFKPDRLSNSKGFIICFVAIPILILSIAYYLNSASKLNPSFSDIDGPIELSRDKRVAEHMGPDFVPGSFRISQLYSEGIHDVRLSFEQFSSSNAFIGIMESASKQSISVSYGWFIGQNQLMYHQPGEFAIFRKILRKIQSLLINHLPKDDLRPEIKQGDIIEIRIDCIHSKITLKNPRTNNEDERHIDLEQSPFPWQMIINFDRHGDRMRLHY